MRHNLLFLFIFALCTGIALAEEQPKNPELEALVKVEICTNLAASYYFEEENLNATHSVGRAFADCAEDVDALVNLLASSPEVISVREDLALSEEQAFGRIREISIFEMKIGLVEQLEQQQDRR